MKIQFSIDRIILERACLSPSQRRHLQADIETELTNLLTLNGIPSRLKYGGALANLSIHLDDGVSEMPATSLSQAIAHAIYSHLNSCK